MPTFNVLVTDEVDPEGVALLRAEPGFRVDERPTTPFHDLLDVIGDYDAIVGRSATKIPAELLRRARKLQPHQQAEERGTDFGTQPGAQASTGRAASSSPNRRHHHGR